MAQQLLTAPEVADRLRITTKTLYNWRSEGIAPKAVKINGALRWKETTVDEFINRLEELDEE